MIEVELINAEYMKDFFKHWGEFACECYNTPIEKAYGVGLKCLKDGHYSGSRAEFFKFRIKGISRACSLQLNRHATGTVVNQKSQRYCNMDNTSFIIPRTIQRNKKALKIYNELIKHSLQAYSAIKDTLADEIGDKMAQQDARYCLLEGCETSGVWAFNLEALINLCNKRMCSRSQWEIRRLVYMMASEVISVLPELSNYLVPQCGYLGFCPESKGCGSIASK